MQSRTNMRTLEKAECSKTSNWCFIYVQSPSSFQKPETKSLGFWPFLPKKITLHHPIISTAAPSARCWPGPVGVATWLNDLSKRRWWPWWMGCFVPHLLVLPFFIGKLAVSKHRIFFGGGWKKKHGRVVCVFLGGWTQNWVKMICCFWELHNHFISAIMKEF